MRIPLLNIHILKNKTLNEKIAQARNLSNKELSIMLKQNRQLLEIAKGSMKPTKRKQI